MTTTTPEQNPTPQSQSSDPTGGQSDLHREIGNATPEEAHDPDADAFVLDAFSETPEFQEGDAPQAQPTPAPSTQPSPPAQQQPVAQAQQQPTAQPQPAPQQAQPAAPPAPATQEQPAPAQQAPQQQPPAAAAVVDPQDSFKQLADAVEGARAQYEQALATSVYQLKTEDADTLMTDPAKAVPQLLARAHVNIVQNVLRTVGQHMPHLVGGLLEARARHMEQENEFYTRWPQLNRQTDEMTVRQLAAAYRTANPTATKDQMIQMVGAQAVVALNRLQAQAPTVQQPTPRQQGFRPAAASSPPAAGVQPTQVNPFAAMAELMMQEDQGLYVE